MARRRITRTTSLRLYDLLGYTGLCLVVAGVSRWSVAGAMVLSGVFLFALALLGAWKVPKK